MFFPSFSRLGNLSRKIPALMSKSTRSNGRRSIKGLIPPVANTRRHRELISPNRGNKRGASRWKIERPGREMDLLELDERWTSASPRRSNGSFVLAKGRRPPFVRLVCSRSAANEKLAQELRKGSELTRGWLWICRNGLLISDSPAALERFH